jgi:hypothetical protein
MEGIIIQISQVKNFSNSKRIRMSSSIQNISLYIPHIFANYTKEDVSRVFEDLNIGKVKNIDFVSKMSKEGKVYNSAYIHFVEWYDTIVAHNFQSRVLDVNKEARLMYEDPWYWIVLENKAQKHNPGDRKTRINLDLVEPTQCSMTTPVKTNTGYDVVLTMAPVKVKNQIQNEPSKMACPLNLDKEFAEEEEMAWLEARMEEEERQMDEIEAAMDEEEQYLVSFDSRYVKSLEEENAHLRQQSMYYYNEYCRIFESYKMETIKAQALADAIQMIKK